MRDSIQRALLGMDEGVRPSTFIATNRMAAAICRCADVQMCMSCRVMQCGVSTQACPPDYSIPWLLYCRSRAAIEVYTVGWGQRHGHTMLPILPENRRTGVNCGLGIAASGGGGGGEGEGAQYQERHER